VIRGSDPIRLRPGAHLHLRGVEESPAIRPAIQPSSGRCHFGGPAGDGAMSQLEEENENHSNQRSRTVMSEFMMVRKKLIADSLDTIEMRTRKTV